MSDATRGRFYITTAIDYPNSRPHIGTAFEKIGADVQARFRRMEGDSVHFLMGNDENTIKVARRAAELERDPKEYCDDMAKQFREVWRALDIMSPRFRCADCSDATGQGSPRLRLRRTPAGR